LRTLHWSDGVFPAPRALSSRPVRHVRPMNPIVVSGRRRQWDPPALAMALSLGMSVAEVASKDDPAEEGAQIGRHLPLTAGHI